MHSLCLHVPSPALSLHSRPHAGSALCFPAQFPSLPPHPLFLPRPRHSHDNFMSFSRLLSSSYPISNWQQFLMALLSAHNRNPAFVTTCTAGTRFRPTAGQTETTQQPPLVSLPCCLPSAFSTEQSRHIPRPASPPCTRSSRTPGLTQHRRSGSLCDRFPWDPGPPSPNLLLSDPVCSGTRPPPSPLHTPGTLPT